MLFAFHHPMFDAVLTITNKLKVKQTSGKIVEFRYPENNSTKTQNMSLFIPYGILPNWFGSKWNSNKNIVKLKTGIHFTALFRIRTTKHIFSTQPQRSTLPSHGLSLLPL